MPGMPNMPMPWASPPPPVVSPWLTVRVDGLKFEYQLTEDDVRKVFSRYGDVVLVKMDREGTTSQVQFAQPHQAMAAQHDLDKKQLAGMSGAYLTVEFAYPQGRNCRYTWDNLTPRKSRIQCCTSSTGPSTAAAHGGSIESIHEPDDASWTRPTLNLLACFRASQTVSLGYQMPTMPPATTSPSQSAAGQPKKFTCKLEVGIENEGEFRVGSRVIQIARSIWQDPKFQEHGGKTRLRGKVQYAETQLQKVHADYKAFCHQHGKPIPELEVKISKKGTFGPEIPAKPSPLPGSGSFVGNRGERPAGAPSDEEIERLIEERNDARKAANFKKADEVREHLRQRGVVLMDEKVSGSTQVVHVILAVDIDMKRVLTSVTLPVTLVNIQINSLNHELYGAGADLTGQYAYYHLCTSTNLTQTVNGITTRQISVGCTLAELGELPTEVNYLYLQSAAIDHQNNYAWFTYKEDATGRPRILEYHQDSKDYVIWPQEIFFALFPPSLLYARFNAAGTKLFLSFDAATLRGAAPIDTNADDIPDSFNEADKATRAPCEDFIDQFTMTLIPGSMCQWTSDADFYIEIDQSSTIAPGDLARLKPGTVYRGEQLPSGAYQFSQPSSDFAIVEPPLEIPTPVAEIGGMRYIDVCTDLTLDGTQSRNHGYRGTFTWALSSTNPVKPEPHIRQLQKVIDDEMLAALPVAAQVLRIPQFLMQAETLYNFSLTAAASEV
eukprot:g30536.t1